MSSDIHGDFRLLLRFHFDLSEAGEDLLLYGEFREDDFLADLDTVSGLLVAAAEVIHDRLNGDSDSEVDELKRGLAALRERSQ